MAIDVVSEINGTRNGYLRMRGGQNQTGKPRPGGGRWMASGQFPNTTWADVFVAANHFNKYLNPSTEQCIDLITKHTKHDKQGAVAICTMGSRGENPRNFVKTKGFNTAKRLFDSVSPMAKGGASRVFSRSNITEIYPFNEEFWGAASTFAIERSAAGEVPFWGELVAESVGEAILELPQTVGSALAAVDPRQLIPTLSMAAQLVKWTAIGGGVFVIWWYVLGGKNKKR